MDQQTRQVIKFITAIVCFSLALAGVVGLAYKIFKPEGWLAQAVAQVWDLQMNFSYLTIPVLLGVIALGSYLFSDIVQQKSKLGTVITYT
ncbi:MAG TPA: hypothetical protein VLL03_01430, partial [Burkholderiales bacterium]|nr:hypothetical protein [Burkholderiales bacterium]